MLQVPCYDPVRKPSSGVQHQLLSLWNCESVQSAMALRWVFFFIVSELALLRTEGNYCYVVSGITETEAETQRLMETVFEKLN